MLIADGVGVGKTIEAGLILRELQARRDMRSILIVCPRPLVVERKWEIEMKRFEENFVHLDSGDLRYCINEMDLDDIPGGGGQSTAGKQLSGYGAGSWRAPGRTADGQALLWAY